MVWVKDNLLNHSSIEDIQVDSSFLATRKNVAINLNIYVKFILFIFTVIYPCFYLLWKKAPEMELLS